MLIKISDDTAAKLGIHTSADALKLLEAKADALAQADTANEDTANMEATISALQERLDALEAALKEIKPADAEALKAEISEALDASLDAKVVASVASVVAKIGSQALPQPEAVEAVNAPKIAPDDYEGQWKADQKLQAEFISWQSYAAYKRNVG